MKLKIIFIVLTKNYNIQLFLNNYSFLLSACRIRYYIIYKDFPTQQSLSYCKLRSIASYLYAIETLSLKQFFLVLAFLTLNYVYK